MSTPINLIQPLCSSSSDHLFLGGTILASLQSEGACLLSDVTRHLAPRVTPREVALSGTFLAALGLYLCTAVDMYFTARYFHYPLVRGWRGDLRGGDRVVR